MATLKLSKNDVLDLAFKAYVEKLQKQMEEHRAAMTEAQAEARRLQNEITQYRSDASRFDTMIAELNDACNTILKRSGFGPVDFDVASQMMGGHVRLHLRMGGKTSQDRKPKEAPKRMTTRLAELNAKAEDHQRRGFNIQEKLRETERSKTEARQAMLMEIAQNDGAIEQINQLVGKLLEADIARGRY
jgi:uncharacterized coiled-coil DUF342 family protein